ncbi:MAG: hypothetical protein ABIG84_02375 [archaeon]
MLIEIIEVLRAGVVAVIQSAINTSKVFVMSLIKAFIIFRDGVQTASYLEIFIVVSVFAFIGYMAFKFLVGSAAQFAKYLFVLILLFVLTILIL